MRKSLFLAALMSAAAWATPTLVMAQTPSPGDDMTHYIANPSMEVDGAYTYDGWTVNNINGGGTVVADHSAMECWNTTFDFYQEITNLPAGVYRLTVQGFYRMGYPGDANRGWDAHQKGTEVIGTSLYCLTAIREKRQPFISLFGTNFTPSSNYYTAPDDTRYCDGMTSSHEAFDAGYYINVVEDIIVGSDGFLRVGAKSTAPFIGGSWTIWDNFTLTYVREAGIDTYREVCRGLAMDITTAYNLQYSGADDIMMTVGDMAASDVWGDTEAEIIATRTLLEQYIAELEAGTIAVEKFNKARNYYNAWKNAGFPGQANLDAVYATMTTILDLDGETAEGNFVYAADIDVAADQLNTAVRAYRLTEPIPAAGNLDVTFAIVSPAFTVEGGDKSSAADATSEGWTVENSQSGGDHRLNFIGDLNCWNNYNSGTGTMDVYQVMTGLPAGYYTFSCYQTNNGPAITTQHAYAQATYTKAVSPTATHHGNYFGENATAWNEAGAWELLTTQRVLVGSDGILRVGMASTQVGDGSSGWFCFTDCQLTYHGLDEGDDLNEITRQALLSQANALLEKDFLQVQKDYLSDAATTLEDANISTDELAEAAFSALQSVMDSAQNAINDMAAFKGGEYATLIDIAENVESLYSDELANHVGGLITDWEIMLAGDDFTVEAYEALKQTVKDNKAYADAYTAAYDYSLLTIDANATIIATVLNTQLSAVQTGDNLSSATQITEGLLLYAKAYDALTIQIENGVGIYTSSALTAASDAFAANVSTIIANQDQIAKYTSELWSIGRTLSLTNEGLDNGDDTKNVTEWIVNPTIEGDANDQKPNGWIATRINAGNSNYSADNQHFSGVTNRYLDSWHGTAGRLQYTVSQEIEVPNGEYKLKAAARTSGNGLYLYANGDVQHIDSINYADHGQIWREAEEDSEIKLANNGVGFGWSWWEVTTSVVNGKLSIGITNAATFEGAKAWDGTWFSVDDFSLTLVRLYADGIDEIEIDNTAPFKVYVENGYITVEGAETFEIISMTGVVYPSTSQLLQGSYFVRVGSKTVKVLVP